MALIKCPECGHDVSDQTNFCPNCGYPIAKNRAMQSERDNDKDNINNLYKDVFKADVETEFISQAEAKGKYLLNGEGVLLENKHVGHGTFGICKDRLVLTNHSLIWQNIGVFGNVKSEMVYPLNDIHDSINTGETDNEREYISFSYNGVNEKFYFGWATKRTLKLWSMALEDRFSKYSYLYDYEYYDSFSDENLEKMVETMKRDNALSDAQTAADFLGAMVTSVAKTGKLSSKTFQKSYNTAIRKRNSNSIKQSIKQAILEDMGFNDFNDEVNDDIIEIKNDFRETFGMEPLKTSEEIHEDNLNKAFEMQYKIAKESILARQNGWVE